MQKRSWLIWGAIFLGWMLIGISFSVNDYVFSNMLRDYYLQLGSFRSMLLWDLIYWPTWAALAPLIFKVARRFPLGQGSWHPNLLINLGAGIVLTLLHRTIYLLIALPIQIALGEESSFRLGLLLYNLPMGLMSYCIILLVRHVADYARNQKSEAHASRLRAELTQAQLQVLRMQLQPHFLFNTLSSISALLNEDVKAADRMLARLGDFLRLTLKSSDAQTVTLEEELDFLRRYLEIEQVRLEERLQVSYELEPDVFGAQVPNLILQPIIENAIKHGVRQSFGQVQIVVSARRENERLSLQIRDNGENWGQGGDHSEGFGLTNTRARLKSAYGADYLFDLRRTADEWTVATLEIPLIMAASEAPAALSR